MKRLRSMAAEEASTDETTAKYSKNKVLPPKLAVTAQIQIFNSKFELRASFCITNLKYHIYEASVKYGRRGGFHRRENNEKQ